MSSTRLIILGVGFVAAIISAFLMISLNSQAPKAIREIVKVPTIETTKVLVAAKRLPRGKAVEEADLKWVDWPTAGVNEGYFVQKANPAALNQMVGRIVRFSLEAGDPASSKKFVPKGQGFMASILKEGKRAFSTSVSPNTAAGGFILPDDRVDVMMTRESANGSFQTEPVLRNVRVLAIDQQVQEKDGVPVVIGETATLELDDDQVRILTVAQRLADQLSLALRSIEDVEEPVTSDGLYLVGKDPNGKAKSNTVSVIRYGKRTDVSATVNGVVQNKKDEATEEEQ